MTARKAPTAAAASALIRTLSSARVITSYAFASSDGVFIYGWTGATFEIRRSLSASATRTRG
jgi:hypothetical protein